VPVPADNRPAPYRTNWGALAVVAVTVCAAGTLNTLVARTAAGAGAWEAAGAALSIPFGLLVIAAGEWVSRRVARDLPPEARSRFSRLDAVSYVPLAVVCLGAIGVRVPLRIATIVVIVALVLASKAAAVYVALPGDRRRGALSSIQWLSFLFLISGFAALIYQIVWQRTLFAAFGVNIESITLIVSLFMVGLGLGSMAGGAISARFPDRAPLLFLLCETGIGLFGVVSLPLIHAVSRATLHGTAFQVGLAVFALLSVPTMLMGATLPLLVGHLYRHYRNVGKSVGLLYCINTIGSAIACFVTAGLLFVAFGQQGAVIVAASSNLLVGVLVWAYMRRIGTAEAAAPPLRQPVAVEAAGGARPAAGGRMLILGLAAVAGYISLSQEIVWMRLVSHMTGSVPMVFAHVLGFFLVGVAGGAYWAERLCDRGALDGAGAAVRRVGALFVASGVFYFVSIAATVRLHAAFSLLGIWTMYGAVAATAFLLGSVFPVLCHAGATGSRNVGLAVSRLYATNIVGSTLGPLVTGFVLLDLLSTDRLILALGVATVAVGGAALAIGLPRRRALALGGAAALVATMGASAGPLYEGFLEKGQMKGEFGSNVERYKYRAENRSGIVAVTDNPGQGDAIFGGGVYDGRFNVDPELNSNGIQRGYLIAGLHPGPGNVLEIGLASASWTRVMAGYEAVERLTVIEINPGYLEVVRHYPDQGSVLTDPKVDVRIDDGRRFLLRNPDLRFDLIVQNASFYWRSHATSLVSEDWLRICRSHLNPGGVMYYNTTGSDEIAYTAARVFRHVVRVGTFIAISDAPFAVSADVRRTNLLRFRDRSGSLVFGPGRPSRAALLEQLVSVPLVDVGEELRARTDLGLITDDNMYTEYKLERWYRPELSWSRLLRGPGR
jgi:spermidine synthase